MDSLKMRLNGSVSDETLSKYDEVSFVIKMLNSYTSDNRKLTVRNNSGSSVLRIVGNGHFTDSTNTQDLGKTATVSTDNVNLYLSDGEYILFVPKYKLTVLQFTSAVAGSVVKRRESLRYSPLTYVNMGRLSFEGGLTAGDIKVDDLITFTINNTGFSADLADLEAAGTSLTLLNLSNCPNVGGDVSSLGVHWKMTGLYLLNDSQVSGDLEDLLDAMHTAGRVSGSISVNIAGSGVLYNGSALSLHSSFTFSSSGWTKN